MTPHASRLFAEPSVHDPGQTSLSMLGVPGQPTIGNERDGASGSVLSCIIAFLGCDPYPSPQPNGFQVLAIGISHGRVAFLPFGNLTLRGAKPKPYPENPQRLGDYLKRRRIELGLTQKEVALRCGVSDWTIHNWETNTTNPPVRYLPRIVAILGYDPYPSPQSVGEQVASRRRHLGLSRKRAAKLLCVDEMTLARWERGDVQPSPQQMTRLEGLWMKATALASQR